MLSADKDGVVLSIRLQPRSSRRGPIALQGEQLKWAVYAPPVDGEANQELLESVSEFFKLPKSQLKLISGEQSRSKRVLLQGVNLERAQELLDNLPS